MSKLEGYTVELVPRSAIQSFIEKYHYSHNTNGVQGLECFALFAPGNFGIPKMVGAMMYAIPSMPNTAKAYNPINPDKCVECVDHHDEPACATACPTEGCITWDMPFTAENKDFFAGDNYIDNQAYVMDDADAVMPMRDDISMDDRAARKPVVED